MPAMVLAREESFGSRREEPEEPKTMRAFARVASLVAVRDSSLGFVAGVGGGGEDVGVVEGSDVGVEVCGEVSGVACWRAASVGFWREESISA